MCNTVQIRRYNVKPQKFKVAIVHLNRDCKMRELRRLYSILFHIVPLFKSTLIYIFEPGFNTASPPLNGYGCHHGILSYTQER